MRPTGLLLGMALAEMFGSGLLAQALIVNNRAQVTGSFDTSVTATSVDRSTSTSSTTTTTSESTSTTSTTSSTSTSTGVSTHTIQVGPKVSPHAYVPHTITANVGDVLVFEFYPTNHSVAKADYLAPCVPAGKDEFWSGEFNTFNEENGELVGDPPTWSLVVNDTEPTFFYCTALGSCRDNGMVGVINPNSSQTFQDQYKRALTYPYMLVPGQSMPAETSDTGSTSSSSSTTSSNNGGSHGLSTGAIAGIAVASVAFVLILAALCWTLGRNRVYEKWMTSQDGRTERTARWALFSSHAHAPVPQKSELDSNTGSGPRTHASDSGIYSYANTSHRMASETEATDTSSMYGSLQRGSGKWNWDTHHQQGRHQRAPTELEANSISPTNVYTREYR